jgi:Domain of unknown function (DUF4389)
VSQPPDPNLLGPSGVPGEPPPGGPVGSEQVGASFGEPGAGYSQHDAGYAQSGGGTPPTEYVPAGGYGPPGQVGGPPGGWGPVGGYGTPAGRPSGVLFDGPAPLLVSVEPPASQNRLTIAFRLVLVIPHLVIVAALGIAALFVTFISWFAALFAGRLPLWAHTFLTGVMRWEFRAEAYLFFLTGVYPPFSLDDEVYPVRLVTARTRLNRAAVFFRIILLIPARIVSVLVEYGLIAVSFFVWLIALVAGRLPEPLHQALAALIRFQLRYIAYFEMVTGEYAWWGLFGDPESLGAGSPRAAGETSDAAAPWSAWRIKLSGTAKALVWLVLAIGLAGAVTVGVARPYSFGPGSGLTNATSILQVEQAYNHATTSTQGFESATQACGGQLSCVTAQDRKEAATLSTFAQAVRSTDLVGQAANDATTLANDASAAARSFSTLATATSAAQYESDVASTHLQQQLNSIDGDYQKLVRDVRF